MSSQDLEKELNKMTYKKEQQEEPKHIFHYTNFEAVKGILESGCIWMTHALYLNDTEEMQTGYEIFQKMCLKSEDERIRNFSKNLKGLLENSSFFVASFSSAPDMLSQWRGYCPLDGGYCIELKNDTNKSVDGICIYDPKEGESYFEELTKKAPEDEQAASIHLGAVLRRIMLMKHKGFSEEREIRWAFPYREGIEFREKNGTPIPYIKQRINLNEVYAIWVGPGGNKKLRGQSMEMYLDKLVEDGTLENKPLVKLSEIPLR